MHRLGAYATKSGGSGGPHQRTFQALRLDHRPMMDALLYFPRNGALSAAMKSPTS
jgi:hypothetical protein